MSMEISGVQSSTIINHYETKISVKSNNDKALTDNNTNNKENTAAAVESATYEKGESVSNGTYSINKMSQADRDKIVEQMKADAAQRQEQLVNLVRKTRELPMKAQPMRRAILFQPEHIALIK